MMKKNHPYSKRVLALFLSVWMLCMQLPMGVFAVDAAVGEVETPTEVVAGALSLGSSVFVEEKTHFFPSHRKRAAYTASIPRRTTQIRRQDCLTPIKMRSPLTMMAAKT